MEQRTWDPDTLSRDMVELCCFWFEQDLMDLRLAPDSPLALTWRFLTVLLTATQALETLAPRLAEDVARLPQWADPQPLLREVEEGLTMLHSVTNGLNMVLSALVDTTMFDVQTGRALAPWETPGGH